MIKYLFFNIAYISGGIIAVVLLYINNDSIENKWLRIGANILPVLVGFGLVIFLRMEGTK